MNKDINQQQLVELRQILATRFDKGELYTLCFDLAIRYDDLPGEGAANKSRELVAYLDRRDRIPQLIRVGKRQRPDILWDEIVTGVGEESSLAKLTTGNEAEAILEEAVIVAEDYLSPQSLVVSDSIAQLIRNSFQTTGLVPHSDNIIPYLRRKEAAYRVVGYVAFQTAFDKNRILTDLVGELVACVGRERREAIEPYKETRPLWQLLVCFTYLIMSRSLNAQQKHVIKETLVGLSHFLRSDASIDPGGECENRVNILMSELAKPN